MVLITLRPKAVAPRPLCRLPPPACVASSPPSSRPQAVAPRPLWRLPPPAYVASSPSSLLLLGPRQWLPGPCGGCPRRPFSRRLRLLSFFSAPGSGSPSPMEVAPAGLCRVVASFFSAPGSGSPSPVEVAPAGLCRVVASFFTFCYFLTETRSFFRQRWPRFDWILRLQLFFQNQNLTLSHLTRYFCVSITTTNRTHFDLANIFTSHLTLFCFTNFLLIFISSRNSNNSVNGHVTIFTVLIG